MLYKLELSYKSILNGACSRQMPKHIEYSLMQQEAIWSYITQRRGTIVHNTIYAPDINFKIGDVIENLDKLLQLAWKQRYGEVVIKLDDGEVSRILRKNIDRLIDLHKGSLSLEELNGEYSIRAKLYMEDACISDVEFEKLWQEAEDEVKKKGKKESFEEMKEKYGEEIAKDLVRIEKELDKIFIKK